jgi:hypothetical protein
MQEKALEKACSKYGRVEHVRVLRDKGSEFPAEVVCIGCMSEG